jgi:tetratricopeptide (TPR) repeat protein
MKLAARVLAIVLCAAPVVAYGDARNDALEEAKREAKQASIHYQLGRFSQAADAYSKSYELVPTPGLLFNLGQCQMALKDYAKAIFFFEGYLRDKPDAPNAALVHDLIAEAHRESAAEQERRDAAEAARLAAARPPAPIVVAPPPPPPGDRRRLPAVALGAASIALVGAALYLGLHADNDAELEHLAAKGSSTHATYASDHRDFVIASAVVGGLGAAAAITSGVLGYLAWRKPRSAHVAVVPAGGGGAAVFSTSF